MNHQGYPEKVADGRSKRREQNVGKGFDTPEYRKGFTADRVPYKDDQEHNQPMRGMRAGMNGEKDEIPLNMKGKPHGEHSEQSSDEIFTKGYRTISAKDHVGKISKTRPYNQVGD